MNPRINTLAFVAASSLIAALALVACGGGTDDADSATSTPTAEATRAAASPTSQPSPDASPTEAVGGVPPAVVTATTTTGAPAPTNTTVPAPPASTPTAPPPPPAAPTQAPPPPPPPAGATITVVARGLKFLPNTLSAQAGVPLTVSLDNQDNAVPHDIVFSNGSSSGVVNGPAVTSVTFTPAAGRYTFKCSIHPFQMSGVLNVQ